MRNYGTFICEDCGTERQKTGSFQLCCSDCKSKRKIEINKQYLSNKIREDPEYKTKRYLSANKHKSRYRKNFDDYYMKNQCSRIKAQDTIFYISTTIIPEELIKLKRIQMAIYSEIRRSS